MAAGAVCARRADRHNLAVGTGPEGAGGESAEYAVLMTVIPSQFRVQRGRDLHRDRRTAETKHPRRHRRDNPLQSHSRYFYRQATGLA